MHLAVKSGFNLPQCHCVNKCSSHGGIYKNNSNTGQASLTLQPVEREWLYLMLNAMSWPAYKSSLPSLTMEKAEQNDFFCFYLN